MVLFLEDDSYFREARAVNYAWRLMLLFLEGRAENW